MHVARLTKLAVKLEQGAPGVAFCLGAPRTTIENAIGPEADPFDAEAIQKQRQLKGLDLSDIACGLDGYAVQLFAPEYPIEKDIFIDPYAQECFSRFAVELLGLPWMDRGPRWDCGHILFEPPERAWLCSPEGAAHAVRRLLSGAPPWRVDG